MPDDPNHPTAQYLGDGVYVTHDRYQIELRVGSHKEPPRVFLDPKVILQLLAYAKLHGFLPQDQKSD